MAKDIQKQNDEGTVFFTLNKKTKKGRYSILSTSSQHKYCEAINLAGFDRLPSGFYTNNGIGLTGAGNFLFQELTAKYNKKIDLTVVASGNARLDSRGTTVKVTISHADLAEINADVRSTKRVRNEEIRAAVRCFLASQFKRQFKDFSGITPQYAAGELAGTLKQKNILARLGAEDRDQLEEFIPEYLESIKGTLRAKTKLQVIFDTLDAGKKVYFKKIIKEFQSKLKRKVQNEQIWQEFLSEYILVLRNSYGQVLEKESVSIQGKYPDFMLLDPYSYLDIYEIKKPTTTLLKYDKSRGNYYWDIEMVKAISQVENYIHQVQRNSDTLMTDIRKNKGIDINIVRPKGYIVAGTRSELKGTKMRDDFRILSEALKNTDVILYDDLLKNLETFVDRIGS